MSNLPTVSIKNREGLRALCDEARIEFLKNGWAYHDEIGPPSALRLQLTIEELAGFLLLSDFRRDESSTVSSGRWDVEWSKDHSDLLVSFRGARPYDFRDGDGDVDFE